MDDRTDIELTPGERRVLRASGNAAVTIQRRRMAVVMGGIMLAALLVAALVPVSRAVVLVAFAVYVVFVIVERVSYANSILLYKSLIRKLMAHVEIDAPHENAD